MKLACQILENQSAMPTAATIIEAQTQVNELSEIQYTTDNIIDQPDENQPLPKLTLPLNNSALSHLAQTRWNA